MKTNENRNGKRYQLNGLTDSAVHIAQPDAIFLFFPPALHQENAKLSTKTFDIPVIILRLRALNAEKFIHKCNI